MKKHIIAILSWLIVAWICKVFLFSIPYKFTNHPDTQHIFGTIGRWMGEVTTGWLGDFFTRLGPYLVGSFEMLTSLVLLAPALVVVMNAVGISFSTWNRQTFHQVGGFMASVVMTGAVFFHLFTPLGIEVLHQGQSDGGSLFYAALSILVLGMVLIFLNRIEVD